MDLGETGQECPAFGSDPIPHKSNLLHLFPSSVRIMVITTTLEEEKQGSHGNLAPLPALSRPPDLPLQLRQIADCLYAPLHREIVFVESLHLCQRFEWTAGSGGILIGSPVVHDEDFPGVLKGAKVMVRCIGSDYQNSNLSLVGGLDAVKSILGKYRYIVVDSRPKLKGFLRGSWRGQRPFILLEPLLIK